MKLKKHKRPPSISSESTTASHRRSKKSTLDNFDSDDESSTSSVSKWVVFCKICYLRFFILSCSLLELSQKTGTIFGSHKP